MRPSSSRGNPEVGIVIPCYNEAEVIPSLIARITAVMDKVAGKCWCLFVDDGSRDGTPNLLTEACRKDPRLALLSLSRNFGHQVAITAGLMHARGDVIMVLDADLQDPPELLPAMLEKWHEG